MGHRVYVRVHEKKSPKYMPVLLFHYIHPGEVFVRQEKDYSHRTTANASPISPVVAF